MSEIAGRAATESRDTEPAGLPMAPAAPPDEGMLMLVPVGGGAFDGLLDLGPGLEPAAFQGQGAEPLPPRRDPVEISGIRGLEDELESADGAG
jgi:hypothetical protein